MSKIEIPVIDKTGWGEGPWQHEPDRVEFEHAGLPCLMQRHERFGHWCGYAAVPPGHPAYGKDLDDIDVEAHGGVTYAALCAGAICHTPKPGEPDNVWWFGFDCAHAFDLIPAMTHPSLRFPDEHYRDLTYVRGQVERLAEQLAAAGTA